VLHDVDLARLRGIDIDESKAARYPIELAPIQWTQSRWPDGTLWTP
jgi:hypothetical protein